MLERKKFPGVGWNQAYDFTHDDWNVARRQLKIILEQERGPSGGAEGVDFKQIYYLIGSIHYGGRLMDEMDEKLIQVLIQQHLTLDPTSANRIDLLDTSHILHCHRFTLHAQFLEYLEKLSVPHSNSLIGLNSNSNTVEGLNQTLAFFSHLSAKSDPAESSEAIFINRSAEDLIKQRIYELKHLVPEKFDLELVEAKFPVDYLNTLNNILVQEVMRYNSLFERMKTTIEDTQMCLEGLISLSDYFDRFTEEIMNNRVKNLSWRSTFLGGKNWRGGRMKNP